jgi:integrase
MPFVRFAWWGKPLGGGALGQTTWDEGDMSRRVRQIEPGIWRMDDGRYQIGYYDPYGRRHYKHLRRLDDARNFKAKVRDDRRRGDYVDPKRSRERFGDFAARWLKTKVGKKPKTYASYESALRIHVLPHFGRMPLASIQREDVQAWIAKLRAEHKSSSTVRKAYQVLAAVLTEAELSRRISRTPAYRIELPPPTRGVQRFLTPEEINTLADAVPPRYRVLILTASYLGLRWGECAGLKAEDLDLDHGFAVIHRTLSEVSGRLHEVPTKGKPAVIPLPRFLCDELNEQIVRYGGEEGYVFTSPEGGPLRHNVYKRIYKRALVEAGLDPRIRFHDLRHTAASIAGSRQYAGEAAKVVQQLLRHSTQQVTTEVYMHLFPEDMERLRNSLDRVYEESSRVVGSSKGRFTVDKPDGRSEKVVSMRRIVHAATCADGR